MQFNTGAIFLKSLQTHICIPASLTVKPYTMKKRSVATITFAFIALAIHAQKTSAFSYKVAETAITGFHRLVVNAGVNVVLLQNDTLKKAFIEGNEKEVNEIRISVSGDVLTITSTRRAVYKGKVQVTIPVSSLSQIDINAAAGIASLNMLQSPELSVTINGDCSLQLSAAGHISFSGAGRREIAYLRTEKVSSRSIDYYENLEN